MQKNIVKKTVPIVYEDETICIVNKPCGIPVQGGARISVCLTDILSRQLGTDIFPVHRLDKETAGLLVTAKTAAAARSCRVLFDSRKVKKEYIAFCFGGFQNFVEKETNQNGEHTKTEGIIAAPITEKGMLRPASTSYRLIAGSADYSLFSLLLHTGRMHQIRLHLAGIGHPIIGDDRHGNFLRNKDVWKTVRIKKLQLCAYRLCLPIGGKNRTFTAELPDHIVNAVAALCPHISLSAVLQKGFAQN